MSYHRYCAAARPLNTALDHMRKAFAILFLLSVAFQAYADDHSKRASEQEIIAATKQLAAADCTPQKDPFGLPIAGCKYSAAFIDGEWSVLVSTMYLSQSGKVGYSPGGDFLYLFKADGTFLKKIRGM